MSLYIELLDLSRRARRAANENELGFLLVNDSRALANYRQAVLWQTQGGVKALSGVVQLEANAPYAQWVNELCTHLSTHYSQPTHIEINDLPESIRQHWNEWLPPYAFWLPLIHSGGLLIAGDQKLNEDNIICLSEWADIWHHAWRAKKPQPYWYKKYDFRGFLKKVWDLQDGVVWWKQQRTRWVGGLLTLLLFPVHLTVLSPAELVPANPTMIRAPLEGVIKEFYVQPNELVKKDQPLFNFDEAILSARLQVAEQSLDTAQAEYRQVESQALNEQKSRSQLALLLGKIEEKRAEVNYLHEQFGRTKVVAPQEGIALFDDPSEWIGKPVQTGERIMRIATPGDAEVEVWLSLSDAIPLPDQAKVRLYLTADPLSSIRAQTRYVAHDAQLRPDGSYAYRLRATLTQTTDQRVGLKGTARVYGYWVPLSYWIIRRPLAVIRQTLGM